MAMSQLRATWVTVRPPDNAPISCIIFSNDCACD